jgi:N-acetylglucosaminyl-diphospho-decaprenol L-rhamnosyltransferase
VKISIIIVSYNVKYFLEQCLRSVQKAVCEWDAEVFVVDNNSSDGSVDYLKPMFPFVQFISNSENTGFARANNQALRIANGQFILFLNPDTILPENFLEGCIRFLEKDRRIGAMGVQMIDGRGRFLKESRRGFPTPWVSFCKLSGLTDVFPHSRLFAKYYLGHLDRNTSHNAEALSGACMLVRKEVLDKTGGFDERFFMYAEDIDLSYRIRRAGYLNYYVADIAIIHFKGESTTKDIHYVKLFYKAMMQFVQKHYTGFSGRLYAPFLKIAIGLRALFTVGGLPLTRQKPKAGLRKIFLKGDADSMKEVKDFLTDLPHTMVHSVAEAHEIVLCEGTQFSFTDMIEEMKLSCGKNYKIHANQTSVQLLANGPVSD